MAHMFNKSQQPHTMLQTWDRAARKLCGGKESRGVGQCSTEQKPALQERYYSSEACPEKGNKSCEGSGEQALRGTAGIFSV